MPVFHSSTCSIVRCVGKAAPDSKVLKVFSPTVSATEKKNCTILCCVWVLVRRMSSTSQANQAWESIQARTFARWMNAMLAKTSSSLTVNSIETDLADGLILATVLEALSGKVCCFGEKKKNKKILPLCSSSVETGYKDQSKAGVSNPKRFLSLFMWLFVSFFFFFLLCFCCNS
jgi:hypothetical protein